METAPAQLFSCPKFEPASPISIHHARARLCQRRSSTTRVRGSEKKKEMKRGARCLPVPRALSGSACPPELPRFGVEACGAAL
ncbi:hypothetical protein MTO96_049148 [Rhipicephalus appendiculatus]